jgi:hypothetical protein
MKKQFALIAVGATAAIAAIGTGYTLFGGATYVSPGNNSNRAVRLVSDTTVGGPTSDDYSGIDFAVPANLTFSGITNLSFDMKPVEGGCGGGAPRFQINVVDPNTNQTKNIFVYAGAPPSYTCSATNTYAPTGNLIGTSLAIDTSQLSGGTFYDTLAHAQATYGSYKVTGIQLVVDSGWAQQGTQVFEVDNVKINDTLYDFEPNSKDDCKNGGWQNFTTAPGPFKNQGQCVSYFAQQQH